MHFLNKPLFYLCTAVLMLSFLHNALSQSSVGIGTNTPSPRTVLQLVVEDPNGSPQGFLVPVLQTLTQRNNINPLTNEEGMVVYVQETQRFYYWDGLTWIEGLGVFAGSPAGGDLNGTYPDPTIRNNAVDNAALANDAITTEKILDGQVTGADLEDIITSNVGTPQGNANTLVQISVDANGRITDFNEINIEIDQTNIPAGTLPVDRLIPVGIDRILAVDEFGNVEWQAKAQFLQAVIAPGQVYVGNASNLAVPVDISGDVALSSTGDVQINPDAVTTAEIEDGTIQTTDIGNLQVETANLADASVTNNKLAADAVENDNVVQHTLGLNKLQRFPTASGSNSRGLIVGDANVAVETGVDFYEARWLGTAAQSVIITNPDGSIGFEARGNFSSNTLPEGNIFVGDAGGQATPLNARQDGRILVGNGTTLGSVSITGDISLTNTGFTDLNVGSVNDNELDKSNIPISGFAPATANVSFGNQRLLAVGMPTIGTDAANRDYVDTQVDNISADNGITENVPGNFRLGGNLLTNTSINTSGFNFTIDNRSGGDIIVDNSNGSAGEFRVNSQSGIFSISNDGIVAISNPTISTSNTTGALVVAGGIATENNINAAGNIDIDGNLSFDSGSPVNDISTDTDLGGISASDNTLPTQLAVRTFVTNEVGDINTLQNGRIYIGNASNQATEVTVVGDATLANDGTLTISTDAVGSSEITNNEILDEDINASAGIAGTKISPDFGSQNITTMGTLNADGATTLNDAVTLGDAAVDAVTVAGTSTFNEDIVLDDGANDVTMQLTTQTVGPANLIIPDLQGTDETVALLSQVQGTDELAELNDVVIADFGAGKILVADGTDSYDEQTLGGDATIGTDGTLTISADAVGSSEITNDAILDEDINSSAGIDVTKLGSGNIDNTEFAFLDGLDQNLTSTSSVDFDNVDIGTNLTFGGGGQNVNSITTTVDGSSTDTELPTAAAVNTAIDVAVSSGTSGTADNVAIYDGSGNLSEEAQLSPLRGGTGVNNGSNTITLGGSLTTGGVVNTGGNDLSFTTGGATSLTLPTSGTVVTLAGTETLTNKTIDASSNTISNITDTEVSASAGIDVTKLGSGNIDNTEFAFLDGLDQNLTSTSSVDFDNVDIGTNLTFGGGGQNVNSITTTVDGSSTDTELPTAASVNTAIDVAVSSGTSGTADNVAIYDGSGNLSEEAQLSPLRGGTGVNNGSNTITLGGSLTTGGVVNTGGNDLSFTTGGATSLTLPTSGTVVTLAGTETLTNKTIDASSNTISNITDTEVSASAGIDVIKLGSGNIDNTEFAFLDGLDQNLTSTSSVDFDNVDIGTNLTFGGGGQNVNSITTTVDGSSTDTELPTAAAVNTAIDGAVSSGTSGTANNVAIYDGSGNLSEEAQLSPLRGGTGVNNGSNTITLGGSLTTGGVVNTGGNDLSFTTGGATSLTLPTSGTVVTLAGTETLTNKTIDASSNTISNITDTEVSASAGIDVTKLGSGNIDNTEFEFLDGLDQNLTSTSTVDFGNVDIGTNLTFGGGGQNVNSITTTVDGSSTDTELPTAAAVNTAIDGAVSSGTSGSADNVAIYDGLGNLSEETQLSQSRGGFGTDVTGFTGVVKSSSGTFSAATIVDADVDANADIARTKLASGTNDHVLINDGSGEISSEAQLSQSRGGFGTDVTGFTGVVKSSSGTFSAATIVDADVDANADIARTKLASGTNDHVLINDGSGEISSEAQLSPSRGGTGVNNGLNTITTGGNVNLGSNNLTFTTSGGTNLTLPQSGTLATQAGLEILTNKTIDAANNTISNISNAEISATAEIDVTKLADPGGGNFVLSSSGGTIAWTNWDGMAVTSDMRLKKNLNPIKSPLDRLKDVKGYNYYWKESIDTTLQYGVMAQEIEKIFPSMVVEGQDGIKRVKYTSLIPVLIEAIKEQQKIIEDLQAKLEDEKTSKEELENALNKQKELMDLQASALLSLQKENNSMKSDINSIKKALGLELEASHFDK